MDARILLGRILQRFIDLGYSQYAAYHRFGLLRYTTKSVWLSREDGEDTPVYFDKILVAIEGYQQTPALYDEGPGKLRDLGLTHVTSSIHSLLHLLSKEDYLL